ncbi:plasmid pRiA4b ORF-3 family protein [Alkalibacterium sp. MB6]|uniref:plasmid pRiA4b ORF-3 family protein n=1 Tax=Alkalibacterium sp. MB6 TaxID=2081965 RepID=UPI00137B7148|nr:plasmid pRiA4b ORF-3 family protein [Alkalibacterium sp. MB6]
MFVFGTDKFITDIAKAKESPFPLSPVEPSEGDSRWFADSVILNRRKAVVLIHEESLLTLVMWPLKKQELSQVENIIQYAKQNYYNYLGLNWMKQMEIEKKVEEREVHLKRAVGSSPVEELIDDTISYLKWRVRGYDEEDIVQLKVMEKVNNRLIHYSDGSKQTPLTKWEDYLNEKGLGKNLIFTPPVAELKVTLNLDLENDVSRTIQVPLTYTFNQLHDILQRAFMWDNYHLHQFTFEKSKGMTVRLVDDEESLFYKEANEIIKFDREVQLIEYLNQGDTFTYEYDFGDDWTHTIEVTNILENSMLRSAKLMNMTGDPVPEDVGGPNGFAEFKNVMNDPSHENYEHFASWSEKYRYRLKHYTKDWINQRLDDL